MAYAEQIPTQDPNKPEEEVDAEAGKIYAQLRRGTKTAAQIAEEMGISRRTLFNRLKRAAEEPRSVVRGRPWSTDAGYHAAHSRIYATRGRAASLQCRECGEPAAQWAYDHEDSAELIDTELSLAYSLSPNHYVPMCHSCHIRFDIAHRRAT